MGAFMDTKQLVREGVWIVGGVMAIAMIMLGIEAIVHDGDVANIIIQQLISVLVWGMPAVTVLLGINQSAAALVAIKSNNTPTQATQPAPVAVAVAPVATQPAPVAPTLAGDL